MCLCVCVSLCLCLCLLCGVWQDLTRHTVVWCLARPDPEHASPFLSLHLTFSHCFSLFSHPHFPSPCLPSPLLCRFSLASALTCFSSRKISILQEGRQPVRPQASALRRRRPGTSRHLRFLPPPFFLSSFSFFLPLHFSLLPPPCIHFLVFGSPHHLYVAVATSECMCDFGGWRRLKEQSLPTARSIPLPSGSLYYTDARACPACSIAPAVSLYYTDARACSIALLYRRSRMQQSCSRMQYPSAAI